MSDTEGWTPTDEDWFRAREAVDPIQSISSASDAATRVLSTIGPIIARERRAAQAEALREAADEMDAWGASGVNRSWLLRGRADEIERGAPKSCDCGVEFNHDCGVEFNHDHGSSTRNVMATPADAEDDRRKASLLWAAQHEDGSR